MIKFKSNQVRIKELTKELSYIFYKLEIFHSTKMVKQPEDLIITSINDSTHKPGSKHYQNKAIDLRSKNFSSLGSKEEFRFKLEDYLGSAYLVLFENEGTENEHFHIQSKL